MFRNYLLIAWRNMRRHSSYTFINLVGLSVGIGCFLLIALYIRYEFSFDAYHEHKDHIYRVTSLSGFNEKSWGGTTQGDPVPAMMGYAEVEAVSRIRHCGDHKIYLNGVWHRDIEMKCTESNFFDIFSINVVQGNSQTFLDRPATGVISQSLAQRLFRNENPIGKILTVAIFERDVSIEITGLTEDIPENTHFKADLFISFETLRQFTRLCLDCGATSVYTRLSENANVAAINESLTTLVRETLGKQRVEAVELEPLRNIHFSERWAEVQGDIRYVYLLSAIALVILLIACANYMNLATARGINRNREVGIRKVVGAMRGQIIRQFLSETVLLTLFAIPIAGFLMLAFTPYFNDLAQTNVTFGWYDLRTYTGLVLVILMGVGLIAGLYPAVFLSRHQPVSILKSGKATGKSGGGLRKVLVGSQFVASIFLILGTTIVFNQLRFLQEKKLGFEYDQVLVVDVTDSDLAESYHTVKTLFSEQSGVLETASGQRFFQVRKDLEASGSSTIPSEKKNRP